METVVSTNETVATRHKLRWLVPAVMAVIALLLLFAAVTILGGTPVKAQTARAMADVAPETPWLKPDPARMLTRIAFGSCLDQKRPQPIWKAVIEARPDLMVMMGDNVYGDVHSIDMRELVEAYRAQGRHPELAAARAAMPFLAAWDDHDYGVNDAGRGFALKAESAQLFASFWQLGEGELPRQGTYRSVMLGPQGQRVQILLLDTRTFRSDLTPVGPSFPHWGRYQPDEDHTKSMLGEAQWAWLEDELKKPAELRLIVSSIQVLADGHGFERWGNLAAERERLLTVIESSGARGVVMLSGDRHAGAFYRSARAGGRQVIDATSSSLNRPYGPSRDAKLPPLVGRIHHVENFGMIEIDWPGRALTLALKGIDGRPLETLSVSFRDIGHDR